MTRRRRPRPITITTSEVIEEQILGHGRGLGATVDAPLARLLRLAKTGSGQASQAHREFVRAAEFEERPLRGASSTFCPASGSRQPLSNSKTATGGSSKVPALDLFGTSRLRAPRLFMPVPRPLPSRIR
jgi:hypothetical protein